MEALTKGDSIRTLTTHYIDGSFVESHGREVMDIIKPTNGQVIGRVTLADEEDTRRAIAAARSAFTNFGRSTREESAKILRRLHQATSAHIGDLTSAMVEEYGGVDKLNVGEDVLIVDLQGRVDHTAQPMAIPGAVRIDPRRLEKFRDVWVSPSREVVLYCASPDEFTSARVALALRQKGVDHVHPLAGGLQGWLDHGFPVTAEVRTPRLDQLNSV
jgi:rhodanese-related sulfurtransferase